MATLLGGKMPAARKISFYIGTHNRDADKFAELVRDAALISHQSQSAFIADTVERAALAVVQNNSDRHSPDE